MAYFECIIGGSSGDGVALVVTCDQNFAGAVITATNGTDTFTETCPSASPYTVRFEDIPVGTYTISGVAQGQTFTTQYTVLDYSTGLYSTPTGATVTPVNDIQIWLHCANIWDKTYTTIAQVLGDASTLQALIASNNAADYMARSTSWASSVTANANAMTYIGNNNYCANKLLANSTWLNAICNSAYFESVLNVKVPTMTSNTTPYGEAFAVSAQVPQGYDIYKAFDGIDDTFWATSTNSSQYIGFHFTNPITLKKVHLRISPWQANQQSPLITVYVQGSNDGQNWDTLHSFDIQTARTLTITEYDEEISNSTPYLYYMITSPTTFWVDGQYIVLFNTLQFYGRN